MADDKADARIDYALRWLEITESSGVASPIEAHERGLVSGRTWSSLAESSAHFDNERIAALAGCEYAPVFDLSHDGEFRSVRSGVVLVRVQIKHSSGSTFSIARDAGTLGGRVRYSVRDFDVLQLRERSSVGRSLYVVPSLFGVDADGILTQATTSVSHDDRTVTVSRRRVEAMDASGFVGHLRRRVLWQEMSDFHFAEDGTIAFVW